MAKFLLCFKPVRENRSRTSGRPGHGRGDGQTGGLQDSVAYVELLKHSHEPLGLVLHGGKDTNMPVQVGAIRQGGVAAKSGALQLGDRILGINGVPTHMFTHSEVNSLLQNAGNVINLEISFESYEDTDGEESLKKTAIINLPLENRENCSYGFTISGGRLENRAITVSNITLNTTAYRNGFLKAGDKILKVNDVDITNASRQEAISLLKRSGERCSLEIQYVPVVHDVLSEAPLGPILVSLLKPRGVSLGISLRQFSDGLKISRIKEAGIADRCGALHVGDKIESINDQSMEGKSVQDAYQLLKHCNVQVQLGILLASSNSPPVFEDTESTVSRLPAFSSQLSRVPSQMSVITTATSHPQITCHPESMFVTVTADEIGFGFGLQGGATEHANYPLVICSIEEGGPAARLGQLQVGDRVLVINGLAMDSCTLQQAVKLVQEAGDVIKMEIMFDIQTPNVPSSDAFDVTLTKTASLNFGITINGSTHRGEQVWINKLKKGGVAYRTGVLQPGDLILAINDTSLANSNLNEAAQLLKSAGDTVTLRINKSMAPLSVPVVYSVELNRAPQQSLGITLSGREQPGHPVIISAIKQDGVAYQTGALKVGDSVLAINGTSLVSTTLSQAVRMLTSAGEVVQLKIRKAKSRSRKSPTGRKYSGSAFNRTSLVRGSGRYRPEESYSRLRAFGKRRPSHSTIATSVSGRSTPDNYSSLSLEQSSFNGSFYEQPNEIMRDESTLRLAPTEYVSAFTRPSSLLSGRLRYEDTTDGYSFSNQHTPTEIQRHLAYRPPSAKDTRSETDEELSQYGYEDSSPSNFTRRSSLPTHHAGSKKWDFKSRTRSMSYRSKPRRIVGLVSPLTPTFTVETPDDTPQKMDRLPTSQISTSSGESYQEEVSPHSIANGPSAAVVESPSAALSVTSIEPSQAPVDLPESTPPSSAGATGSATETKDAFTVVDTKLDNRKRKTPSPVKERKTPSPKATKERKTPSPRLKDGSSSSPKSLTRGLNSAPDIKLKQSPSIVKESSVDSGSPKTTAMKTKHPRTKSVPGFESPTLQEYKRTINKADEFEREMRKLAESGSSDSDAESYSQHSQEPTVRETEKIQEKMRSTVPLNDLKVHQFLLKRKPGTSFGFSLADGCFDPWIFIKAVKSGSPADKAGVQQFDILLKFDDVTVQNNQSCETIAPLLKKCSNELELIVARQHQH